jgi:hypothetical protein
MLVSTIIVVVVIFVLIFLVHFVVMNVEMFRSSFDIIIGVPLIERWSYTLEGVEFIYIIGGSVLLGALVIVLGSLIFDTKRKVKLIGLRKELKRLQQAVQEAKSSLPPESQPSEKETVDTAGEFQESTSPTPEEITKSFEDTVQQRGFLEKAEETESEPEDEPVDEPKGEQEISEKRLPREIPVEAEVIESESIAEEEPEEKEKEESEE